MKKRAKNFVLPFAFLAAFASAGAFASVEPPASGLPRPAGYACGHPFYADYDYFYEARDFAAGKNFKTFADDGSGGEKVWIWFSNGVSELRIYEVDYAPGPTGEYQLDRFSLGRELYSTRLGKNDVLEYVTAIPEAAPPRRAIWFKDPGGGARSYMLGWNGSAGAVNLRPLSY
jgi:hypothetical protein